MSDDREVVENGASAQLLLPSGTLVYREYEARMADDSKAQVAITLSDLEAGSEAAAAARRMCALAYGYVLVLDGAGRPRPPMMWLVDDDGLHVFARSVDAGGLGEAMREAIAVFALHFCRGVGLELDDAVPQPTTVH